MAGAALNLLLEEAETRPFVGWDVGYGGRITTGRSWDFAAIVAAHVKHSPDLLDIDTGGGEWLGRLSARPARTVAIEAWPPNVGLARTQLAPLGVEVIGVLPIPMNSEQDGPPAERYLPFEDGSFHLISCRHGSYYPSELARVLVPGGIFLTQQVGSGASDGYYRLLGEEPPVSASPWNLEAATGQLRAVDFEIVEAREGFEEVIFADVGALAWYLQNLPFVCPGFSIADARSRLACLHDLGEPLRVRLPSFWLKAERR